MIDLDALVEQLQDHDRARGPGSETVPAAALRQVLGLAVRYARIEKLVLGGARISYSSSALGLDLALDGDVLEQGEALAEAERVRFDLGPGPILELEYLVEEQGLKVLPCAFPPGTKARGGFLFDSELGPCILADACLPSAERDYVVAHQYGHFLADYDPYITTLCPHPDPASLLDPREMRAHQFALALLMPRADCKLYRDALGGVADAPVSAELVRQMQVYFETDAETALSRLLSLGWLDAAKMDALLRAAPDLVASPPERMPLWPHALLPERFIRLVAGAFRRKQVDLEGAAEYLELPEGEASAILEQFHEEEPQPSAPGAPRPAWPRGN